jgi:hypothetical protein
MVIGEVRSDDEVGNRWKTGQKMMTRDEEELLMIPKSSGPVWDVTAMSDSRTLEESESHRWSK